MTRERWALELEARARAHWTDARTDELLRGKGVAVRPRDAAVLLRALGILNADASMPPATVRKYFQINHVIGTLGRAIADLRGRHPVVRIVDAGCGRSYLTMLLAWCGARVWDHRIDVLGVDRDPDVIAEGRRRAAVAGLDDRVRFAAVALDGLDVAARWRDAFGATRHRDDAPRAEAPADGAGEDAAVHAVIALHACDRATCDAIALGVDLGAELIAVAPCCQAELARGWAARGEAPTPPDGVDRPLRDAAAADEGGFAPVWRTPHLRREIAAHTTDLMRTLLLRAAGYQVTALEFVPDEHTRKNTLLRAHRGPEAADAPAAAAAATAYRALVATTGGVGLALAARLAGKMAS